MAIDSYKLNQAIIQAFHYVVGEFAQATTEMIDAEMWEWPRATTRSTGQIATSPRDIVDTGHLRDSQVVGVHWDEAEIAYPVHYAAYVHEGTSKAPSRPFFLAAVEEVDWEKMLAREIVRRL